MNLGEVVPQMAVALLGTAKAKQTGEPKEQMWL